MTAFPKEDMIRSTKVLRSASGQPCTACFPGICNGDDATTVWAHLNGHAFGKGGWIKAHDMLGFHACYACHSYYDVGHGTRPLLSTETLLEHLLRAVCETWVRLIKMKVVLVPLDAERLNHDKPAKPRKPLEQRRQVGKSRPLPRKGEGRKLQSRKMERAQ